MGMRLQRNFVKQAVYKSIEKTRVCQNDASSFSLYNHRFAIFHRV